VAAVPVVVEAAAEAEVGNQSKHKTFDADGAKPVALDQKSAVHVVKRAWILGQCRASTIDGSSQRRSACVSTCSNAEL
jgi:hypothetical protein